MDITYRTVLDIIKSAITGERISASDNTDWQRIIKIASVHQIIPMIFYGLKNSNIQTPFDEKLFDLTTQSIVIEQQQLGAIDEIGKAFSANGIDHAFLKGCRIKYLYPHTEMRVMGDLDILIKPDQYGIIKPTMERLGFTEDYEWDYEYHWRKGYVHIELHKSLMPTDEESKDLYEFFSNGWDRFLKDEKSVGCYTMSAEDELIFLLAHLIKHFRFSGIGVRHFTDIYIYNLKHSDIDKSYLETQLKKLGFFEFYQNVIATVQNWFGDGENTEITEIITKRVFESGSYGTLSNNAVANASLAAKKEGSAGKAKVKDIFKTVFLPLESMKERYCVLNRLPFLLPLFWVVRWVVTFFRPKNIKGYLNRVRHFNDRSISDFNDQLKKVGL